MKNIGHQGGLTPHQDVSAKVLDALRAKFAPLIARPGDYGARARIRLAVMCAFTTAMAIERDNGMRMSTVGTGISEGIADITASFVVTAAGTQPKEFQLEGVEHVINQANRLAVDAVTNWNEMGDNEVTGLLYQTTPMAKAD